MLEPIAADDIASGQADRTSTMSQGSKHARILLAGQSVDDFRHKISRNSGTVRRSRQPLRDRGDDRAASAPARGLRDQAPLRAPNRDAWRSRAGLSPWAFRRLTEVAEKQLRPWEGRYDLVLLVQTLFSPGLLSRSRHYVVYTDNIHILTARYFRAWSPLSERDRAKRIGLERATCRGARYVREDATSRDALSTSTGLRPERVVRVGSGSSIMARALDGSATTGRWRCSSGPIRSARAARSAASVEGEA